MNDIENAAIKWEMVARLHNSYEPLANMIVRASESHGRKAKKTKSKSGWFTVYQEKKI